jgi:hypothetical protein
MSGASEATLAELLATAETMNVNLGKLIELGGGKAEDSPYGKLKKESGLVSDAFSMVTAGAKKVVEVGLNLLLKAVGTLVSSMAGLAVNMYQFGKAAIDGKNTLSGFYKQFSGLPYVGTFFSLMADQVEVQEKLLGHYQNITKVGAAFGGSLTELRMAAQRANLTLDELSKVVSSNSGIFASFGLNINTGVKMFVEAQGKLMGPNSAYGRSIYGLGVTAEEAGGYLATVMEQQVLGGKKNMLTTDQLAARTKDYVFELDALSKLTGIQREKLDEEIKKIQQDELFNQFLETVGDPRIREQVRRQAVEIGILNGQGAKEQFMASIRGVDAALTKSSQDFAVTTRGQSIEHGRQYRQLIYDTSLSEEERQKRMRAITAEGARAVSDTAKTMGTTLTAIPEVAGMFSTQALKFARLLEAAGDGPEAFNDAMKQIYKEQEKQSKGSAGAMGQAAQSMKMAGTAIFDIIGAFIGPLAPILKEIASTLTDMLEGALKGIAKPLGEMTKTMLEKIKPALQNVADWFGETWRQLSNVQGFDGVVEVLKDRLGGVFDSAKKFVLPYIKSAFESMIEFLEPHFEKIIDMIGEQINKFLNKLPGFTKFVLGDQVVQDQGKLEASNRLKQAENEKARLEKQLARLDELKKNQENGLTETQNNRAKEITQALTEATNNLNDARDKAKAAGVQVTENKTRHFGTSGVLGMISEPKDTTVAIQAGERVLNKNETVEYNSLQDLMQSVNTNLGTMIALQRENNYQNKSSLTAIKDLNGNLFAT